MRRQVGLSCVVLLTILVGLQPAAAAGRSKKAPPPQAAASAPAPAPQQVTGADADRLRLLIYTTLIAVNQANLTGNYSVLRDLAAPGFREVNSAARLTEIFGDIRRRNLDLSPILLLDPKLVRPPALTANGNLRVSGFFPSAPEQVNFDMVFQPVGGRWLLFGVALNTSPAANAGAAGAPMTNGPAGNKAAEATTSTAPPAAQAVAVPAGTKAVAAPLGKAPGWLLFGIGAAPPGKAGDPAAIPAAGKPGQ